MSTLTFIVAAAALAAGTYLIRLTGVVAGARARNGTHSSSRVWIERATVLLILGVAVTTMLYDGQVLTGPSRIIGVASGVGALLLKAPMLVAVVVAMVVCAALRAFGVD